MKRLLFVTLVSVFMLGLSTSAQAVILSPGDDIAAVSETIASYAPSTTVVLPKTDTAWSYGAINGTLSQWIYRDDSDGNLIFAYQVINGDGSHNGLSAVTVTDYTGFSTYVAYESKSVSPLRFDRASSGNTVGFRFGFEAINPTYSSAILWVKTDTPYYGLGETSIINGGSVNVPTYAPVVPEPASMLLLGIGLIGAVGRKFRKKVIA